MTKKQNIPPKVRLTAVLQKHIEKAQRLANDTQKKFEQTQKLQEDILEWLEPFIQSKLIRITNPHNTATINKTEISTATEQTIILIICRKDYTATLINTEILNDIKRKTEIQLTDSYEWIWPSNKPFTKESFYEYLCNELEL
jgi:hypothetical protein